MNWLQKTAQNQVEFVARRNIDEEFSRDFFNQPNDGFLYHVTSSDNLDSIAIDGLTSGNPPMFEAGSYSAYSRGKVFLTERSGLGFWDHRVEYQLRHKFDEPPDIIIVRIPKMDVAERIQEDTTGTEDATEPSYYIEDKGYA